MGVLQVRVDDELKKQATEIFNELGIDLSTAVRMFLKKAVLEKGLPFDAKIDAGGLRMLAALEEMQKKSKENGNSEMTLDEINEEIRLAREERRNRKEVK
jgi:DNA-damage-inducible protein J